MLPSTNSLLDSTASVGTGADAFHTSSLLLCGWESGNPRLRVYRPAMRQQMMALQGTGAMMHDTAFKPHEVLAACHAPQSHCFVTSSQEGAAGPFFLSYFDDQTHALLKRVETRTAVTSLAYAESMGLVYACGREPRAIRGWDPRSYTVRQRIPQVGGAATCMAPLPGHVSKTMLTGGTDGCLHVYDLRAAMGMEGLSLAAHEMGVLQVRVARRLRVAVSIGTPVTTERACPRQYNTALVWDLEQWLAGGEGGGGPASSYSSGPKSLDVPGPGDDDDGLFVSSKSGQGTTGGGSWSGGEKMPDGTESEHDGNQEDEDEDRHQGLEVGRTASGRRIRPGVLFGHEYGLVAIAVQDDEGVLPHVVTGDCGGFVRVWHPRLCTCLQVFSPVLPSRRLAPPAALGGAATGPGGVPRSAWLVQRRERQRTAEMKRRAAIDAMDDPTASRAGTSQAYGSALARRRAQLEEDEEAKHVGYGPTSDDSGGASDEDEDQRLREISQAGISTAVMDSNSIHAIEVNTSRSELERLSSGGNRRGSTRGSSRATFRRGGRKFQLIKQTGDLKEDSIDKFAHSQAVTLGALAAAGIAVGDGEEGTEGGARTDVGNTEISLRIQSQAEAVGRRMSVSRYALAIGTLKQVAKKDERAMRGAVRNNDDEDEFAGGDEDWWADPTQLDGDNTGGGQVGDSWEGHRVGSATAVGANSEAADAAKRKAAARAVNTPQMRRRDARSNAGISHRNRHRMLRSLRSMECLPCEVGGPDRRPTLALLGDKIAIMSF